MKQQLESVCKLFKGCEVAKKSGRDCSAPAYLDCQTFKMNKKYGKNYLLIAIGEQSISPGEINP